MKLFAVLHIEIIFTFVFLIVFHFLHEFSIRDVLVVHVFSLVLEHYVRFLWNQCSLSVHQNLSKNQQRFTLTLKYHSRIDTNLFRSWCTTLTNGCLFWIECFCWPIVIKRIGIDGWSVCWMFRYKKINHRNSSMMHRNKYFYPNFDRLNVMK